MQQSWQHQENVPPNQAHSRFPSPARRAASPGRALNDVKTRLHRYAQCQAQASWRQPHAAAGPPDAASPSSKVWATFTGSRFVVPFAWPIGSA